MIPCERVSLSQNLYLCLSVCLSLTLPIFLLFLSLSLPSLPLGFCLSSLLFSCLPPEQVTAPVNKLLFADVLSVLGMVSAHETRDALKYKLQGNSMELGVWGHEYIRHLAGEISEVRTHTHTHT